MRYVFIYGLISGFVIIGVMTLGIATADWGSFAEIFPVGLVVALVSAALLRNPRVLPAR